MTKLTGIHAVREALASGRALERVVVAHGRHGERIEEIIALARSRGVPVRFENREQLDRLAESAHHQGVVALAADYEVPPTILEYLNRLSDLLFTLARLANQHAGKREPTW